jgi:hypothetical protein
MTLRLTDLVVVLSDATPASTFTHATQQHHRTNESRVTMKAARCGHAQEATVGLARPDGRHTRPRGARKWLDERRVVTKVPSRTRLAVLPADEIGQVADSPDRANIGTTCKVCIFSQQRNAAPGRRPAAEGAVPEEAAVCLDHRGVGVPCGICVITFANHRVGVVHEGAIGEE